MPVLNLFDDLLVESTLAILFIAIGPRVIGILTCIPGYISLHPLLSHGFLALIDNSVLLSLFTEP